MQLPHRLSIRIGVALSILVSSTVVAIATLPSVPSGAGPASGLCQMDTSRGSVPASFPIDACLNGSTLYLRNTLSDPIDVVESGSLGSPAITTSHPSATDAITREILKNPSDLLLPGDVMAIPYGSSASTLSLKFDNTLVYAFSSLIEGALPTKAGAALSATETFVASLNDDFYSYENCLSGKNFIGQAACTLGLSWDWTYAATTYGLTIGLALAKNFVGDLLAEVSTIKAIYQRVAGAQALNGQPSMTIGSVPLYVTTTTETGSGGGSGSSTGPSRDGNGAGGGPSSTTTTTTTNQSSGSPSITISWGSVPAPHGSWMNITFTNFPTGRVSWTCVEEGRSYGPYSTTLTTSPDTLTTSTCDDVQSGGSDYVTAGGATSNTIPTD